MKFILSVINDHLGEGHVNHKFDSMGELLSYVHQCGHAWTSLLVIVLPSEENKNEA